ncbi:site-specific recombination directionality factor RDF [Yersinia phage vB_YenM_P744]
MKKSLLLPIILLLGCDDAANVASRNVSKASDNFEVQRRFIFYNGITGEYILTIEGLCSKDNSSTENTLGVICKVGPDEYKKHMLGLSDNVTWFMEQMSPAKVSTDNYRVTFKPSVIIPDIRVQ